MNQKYAMSLKTCLYNLLVISGLFLLLTACDKSQHEVKVQQAQPIPAVESAVTQTGKNYPVNVYFGDLHLHSNWSFDAYSQNVPVGPEAVYAFAQGKPIAHSSGGEIQLVGPPLDFIALTEHAEYLGVSAGIVQGDAS